MNILKRILLVITLFLVLIVAVSLFLPSSFNLSRNVIVDADREQIFNQVNELKNLKNWAPWALKDISIFEDENSYSIPSKGEGASFVWSSQDDDLGSGKLIIKEVKDQEIILTQTELDFLVLNDSWEFNENEDGVEVIWSTSIDFGFNPISKFFGLFIEDEIAKDFELGLSRLKEYSEELPKIKRVVVEQSTVSSMWFLSLRDSVNPAEMINLHGKMYAELNQFMDDNRIQIMDKPLVIYHYWSDTLIDIEAGIPIYDSLFVNDDEIKLNKIDSGNVVTAIHYGTYDRLPETYFGINEWMRRNKVVVSGPPWEIYLTDPAIESNPDNWQTAIFFPIK
jgi:effector-binding domain-containing protein